MKCNEARKWKALLQCPTCSLFLLAHSPPGLLHFQQGSERSALCPLFLIFLPPQFRALSRPFSRSRIMWDCLPQVLKVFLCQPSYGYTLFFFSCPSAPSQLPSDVLIPSLNYGFASSRGKTLKSVFSNDPSDQSLPSNVPRPELLRGSHTICS